MRTAASLTLTIVAAWAVLAPVHSAQGKYTVKVGDAEPPKELHDSIRPLLEAKPVQVYDPKGQLYCEVWFRKAIPAKATDEQVKNGLTYREFPQTTIFGAIRFHQAGSDYRKQEVPPGVYTLRLVIQPQDGDHQGTAPHPEFCALVAAKLDTKPDVMEPKALHELSARSLEGSHPAVLLLFPPAKPGAKPEIADHGMDHWVLKQPVQVEVNGKRVPLGINLTIVGSSPSA
jgi:hypothetical protein